MTEHEMVGWHHQLGGHEFEQALGVGDGQGSLACYSLWGCKELDLAEPLNPLKKRKKKQKKNRLGIVILTIWPYLEIESS